MLSPWGIADGRDLAVTYRLISRASEWTIGTACRLQPSPATPRACSALAQCLSLHFDLDTSYLTAVYYCFSVPYTCCHNYSTPR